MSKICGYSCEHNKSGVCQISVCDKKSIISDKTEVQTLRLDKLDYTIIPNSDIKPLLDRLQQENKQLKEKLDCDLQWAFKYEKQVNNWNKLKEYIDIKLYNVEYLQKLCGCKIDDETHMILDIIKKEMQELEQGSDDYQNNC